MLSFQYADGVGDDLVDFTGQGSNEADRPRSASEVEKNQGALVVPGQAARRDFLGGRAI